MMTPIRVALLACGAGLLVAGGARAGERAAPAPAAATAAAAAPAPTAAPAPAAATAAAAAPAPTAAAAPAGAAAAPPVLAPTAAAAPAGAAAAPPVLAPTAAPAPAPAPAPVPAPAAPAPGQPPPPAAAPASDHSLEVGGRVFVRDTLSRVEVAGAAAWSHDRTIDSGRLFANYRREHLKLALEVEFAGGARLKDTYIRLWPDPRLRVQAGRFKVPISYLALESKWSLPSIERGLLSEVEPDARGLPFAGQRDDGVELELRPDLALSPRLTLASVQTSLPGGSTQLDPTEDLTQDLYARLEAEPVHDLHLASTLAFTGYNAELGRTDTYHHVPMVSAELFFDGHALRAWLEGFTGKSFIYHPDRTTSGAFWAARALVSPRLHRPASWLWRLEPYVSGSVLDPSTDVSGDRISEVVGGVCLRPSKYWRVQIEVADRIAEGLAAPVADSTLIRVQLGSAFAEELH